MCRGFTFRRLSLAVAVFVVAGLFGCALAAGLPSRALAADGVPVFAAGTTWGDRSVGASDMAGDVLAWESWDWSLGGGPTSFRIAAYDLAVDNGSPTYLYDPITVGLGDQLHPSALVTGGKLYVVWQQQTLGVTSDNNDDDIYLWRGTVDPATGDLTPDGGFPVALVTGPGTAASGTPTAQTHPSIGLVRAPGGPHIVVAWEDCRATAPNLPETYYLDLTTHTGYEDPDWDPSSAGTAFDPTGLMGRGQRDPDVGIKGVFWRDERYSYYDPSDPWDPTDTAIWHADLSSGVWVSSAFWTESVHQYDNLMPLATSTGAVWFRHLSATGLGYRLWSKAATAGAAGAQLTDAVDPFMADVQYSTEGGRNSLVFSASHADISGGDQDIFFFDTFTGQRVPVCSVGSSTWHGYNIQTFPAVGTAVLGKRVTWADARNNAPNDSDEIAQMNSRLYEAFLPRVTLVVSRTTLLHGFTTTLRASVSPAFAGAKVSFQLVRGASAYVRSKALSITTLKTMTLDKGSSAAILWRPLGKGTYWVRAWFTGGKLYGPDGATLAKDPGAAIPHVPNASALVKVVVK